jgi:TetR/AcrR family transcriptional repressor of nem operon
MNDPEPIAAKHAPRRQALLDAALTLVRTKGYAATSVDDLCDAASVTKGTFFHYFKNKEDLAVAAVNYWSDMTGAVFAAAPYHKADDPLDRVLAYIDFRKAILQGEIREFTCFAGTMVQEIHDSHPIIRAAVERSIFGHAETLVADITEAMSRYEIRSDWTAGSLALHTQAVLQGAFILAKASGRTSVAVDSVDHLRRYVSLLFGRGDKHA